MSGREYHALSPRHGGEDPYFVFLGNWGIERSAVDLIAVDEELHEAVHSVVRV